MLDNTNIELRCFNQNRECQITNKGSSTINIDAYSLTAVGAATPFVVGSWRSIQDALVASPSQPVVSFLGAGSTTFTKVSGLTNKVLAELNAAGVGVWAPGSRWAIGTPFGTGGSLSTQITQAVFQYTTRQGAIYQSPIVTADLTGTALSHCGTSAGGLGSLANPSGTYYLQNDIDCSSVANFSPVVVNPNLTFELNGNMKVIRNLTINRPTESHTGLFKDFTRGNIHHLTVATGPAGVIGYYGVGILAGAAGGVAIYPSSSCPNDDGTISHVVAQGTVSGTQRVGGIIGYGSFLSMRNSRSEANISTPTVVAPENGSAGGLVGQLVKGQLYDSTVSGSITGAHYIGRGIGLMFGPRFSNGGWYSNIGSTATITRTGAGTDGIASGEFPNSYAGCSH